MPSLLRKRYRGHSAEVTSVELFFDLVFVIAVTQISHAATTAVRAGAAVFEMIWYARHPTHAGHPEPIRIEE